MANELPKTYDPSAVEDKLYQFWNDSGFFHAEVDPDKEPFTIVIPPSGYPHPHEAYAGIFCLMDARNRSCRYCNPN